MNSSDYLSAILYGLIIGAALQPIWFILTSF